MRGPTGKRTYLLPVLLAFALSFYLVGGTGNLNSTVNQSPHIEAMPRPNSGSSDFAGAAQKKQLEIGTFDFITATPAPVPTGSTTDGLSFSANSISTGNAIIYSDEQQDLLSKGLVQSADTIAGTPATKLTGTLPDGDINGQHIQSPTQATIYYATHGDKIFRLSFEYLGATKDATMEQVIATMLSTYTFP